MQKGKGLYPGCLAMIVGLPEGAPDNGNTVICVRQINQLDWIPGEPYRAATSGWLVHSEGRPLTIEIRDGLGGKLTSNKKAQETVVPSKHLLPLGGPDLAIDTDTAKPKEAPTQEDVY